MARRQELKVLIKIKNDRVTVKDKTLNTVRVHMQASFRASVTLGNINCLSSVYTRV